MIKRVLLLLALLLGAVGCTDTPDSLAREYRNTTNEGLDAMMMVTSDRQAYRMNVRVFSTLRDRYDALDKKLELVRSNRTKKEFITEIFASDGVNLYFSELEVNKQRYTLEITRLRHLYGQYMDRERKRLEDLGEDPEKANENDACPNLAKIMGKGGLDSLRNQLTQPKLLQMVTQFGSWKVEEFTALHKKMMDRRGSLNAVDVELVW